jgi:plastin-1
MKAEGAYHTVLDSERIAFTNHVNEVLKDDKDIKNRLPINEKEIFEAVGDGVILWYLVPHAAS